MPKARRTASLAMRAASRIRRKPSDSTDVSRSVAMRLEATASSSSPSSGWVGAKSGSPPPAPSPLASSEKSDSTPDDAVAVLGGSVDAVDVLGGSDVVVATAECGCRDSVLLRRHYFKMSSYYPAHLLLSRHIGQERH